MDLQCPSLWVASAERLERSARGVVAAFGSDGRVVRDGIAVLRKATRGAHAVPAVER